MLNDAKNKKRVLLYKILVVSAIICIAFAILIIGLYLSNTEIFAQSANYMRKNYASAEANTWDVSANEDGSLTATLSDDGVLTISGIGDMRNYDWYNDCSPWYSMRQQIKNIEIEDGINGIGENAFYNCYNVKSIEIPDSVINIGGGK